MADHNQILALLQAALLHGSDTIEVGLTYHPDRRWCVYQRIGAAYMIMRADQARLMADIFDRAAKEPRWKEAGEGLRDIFSTLKPLADEADKNNRNNVLPPAGLATMPHAGHA